MPWFVIISIFVILLEAQVRVPLQCPFRTIHFMRAIITMIHRSVLFINDNKVRVITTTTLTSLIFYIRIKLNARFKLNRSWQCIWCSWAALLLSVDDALIDCTENLLIVTLIGASIMHYLCYLLHELLLFLRLHTCATYTCYSLSVIIATQNMNCTRCK